MSTSIITSSQTKAQHQDKVGFFKEDNGNYSSVRLMSFIGLIAAIVFGGYTITHPDVQSGTEITFTFLTMASGSKVIQKFAEKKKDPDTTRLAT